MITKLRRSILRKRAKGAMGALAGLPRGHGVSLSAKARLAAAIPNDVEATIALERMTLGLPPVASIELDLLRKGLDASNEEFPRARGALKRLLKDEPVRDESDMDELRRACAKDEQMHMCLDSIESLLRIKVAIGDHDIFRKTELFFTGLSFAFDTTLFASLKALGASSLGDDEEGDTASRAIELLSLGDPALMGELRMQTMKPHEQVGLWWDSHTSFYDRWESLVALIMGSAVCLLIGVALLFAEWAQSTGITGLLMWIVFAFFWGLIIVALLLWASQGSGRINGGPGVDANGLDELRLLFKHLVHPTQRSFYSFLFVDK